ncbi:aminopeptidase P family protein [Sphaerisporangium sp. NPDC051011]|uniref:aminopeptidase P family protein n=1 Tax=Sphaerisporangium sp. NPDC051011 TaxID=3155792 RepID=UPI0033EA4EF1
MDLPESGPNTEDEPSSHKSSMPEHLQAALSTDWDPAPPMPHPARPDFAPHAARRRAAVSEQFPGTLVVVPAGSSKARANDTDYPFRAASSFTWLTGETIADAVLVMTPSGDGHHSTLYVAEHAKPGELEYFMDYKHSPVWVGNVPSGANTSAVLGIEVRPLPALADDLAAYRDDQCALLRGFDNRVDKLLAKGSGEMLGRALDELRLVKDEWEVARLRHACEATARGFADVVRELPAVVGRDDLRGERWLEGTFWRRARLEGNEVGYTSVVASGPHATTPHWWRNHGVVHRGALLLTDMGVETDELYTADVTRTLPVDGAWTPAQLKVYRAVQEAQAAGIAEVKAGNAFVAAHKAAMYVIADHLHSWGILPVTADVACADDEEQPGAGLHRRFTLHGTSHMLGIDVHDCALARMEQYRTGTLTVGHVLTVEPGLYFQTNDRAVPQEFRGIGVRIEDDVLVTDGEPVNLSAMLPRDPDDVIAWMRDAQHTPAIP